MRLSIIIPVYNKKRYLSGLFEQIMVQTFKDFECLLIDDGSTDGSGEICDEFAKKDPRFRVIHIPNGGVSHARNVGLDAAQGEYVTFIDSDDGILPGYLEKLVCSILQSGADLAISGFDKVTEDGMLVKRIVPMRQGIIPFQSLLADFVQEQRATGIYGYCFSKIYARKLLGDVRFDESLKLAEDFDFNLKIYERLDTVCLTDHTDYLYLQDADNSTGNIASEKIDYLAQIRINLHYRAVLQKLGAYTDISQEIVEGRLCDYAFFVLFHTPLPHYQERFETLCGLCEGENIRLTAYQPLRKWLFFCLRHHCYHAAKQTMTIYRAVRKIKSAVVGK